jgi:hypothetical protein
MNNVYSGKPVSWFGSVDFPEEFAEALKVFFTAQGWSEAKQQGIDHEIWFFEHVNAEGAKVSDNPVLVFTLEKDDEHILFADGMELEIAELGKFHAEQFFDADGIGCYRIAL